MLATPENMQRWEELHPTRTLPNGVTIEGRRCFAYSHETGERCSATSGDYWDHPSDQPLLDSEGEPMVLAVEQYEIIEVDTDA